jgi:hypothetical protein
MDGCSGGSPVDATWMVAAELLVIPGRCVCLVTKWRGRLNYTGRARLVGGLAGFVPAACCYFDL